VSEETKMKKMLLLVVLSGMLLGTSCPGGTPALTCSNELDASRFGFTITIPQNFACDAQLPSYLIASPILAVVLYADRTQNWGLEVIVLEPPTAGSSSDLTDTVCEEPVSYTANGVEFAIKHCTTTRNGTATYSYTAAAEITSGGNLLGIYISSATDDAAMLTALESILDTFQRTSAS
jgi:hypothetical protein